MSHLPAPMHSGGTVAAIVPQNLADVYQMAKAVVAARLAPKGLETVEACVVAIVHGMEIGMKPMASLQRIAVVNGRPTIWGDAALGLVRASGLAASIEETIVGEGDARTAMCSAIRKGEPVVISRRFSVADAKKAGLWGKGGPWTQYPDRMLQMRARAFCLRDGFPDVLGGLYLREEIEEDARPPRPARPAPLPPVEKIEEVLPMAGASMTTVLPPITTGTMAGYDAALAMLREAADRGTEMLTKQWLATDKILKRELVEELRNVLKPLAETVDRAEAAAATADADDFPGDRP